MTYSPQQQAEKTGFVTDTPLAIGGIFTLSPLLNVDGYSQVQTEIRADQDGTIDIRFCSDLAGTDTVRSLSIPYIASDGFQLYASPAFANYVEYKFINTSGVAQTDFYFTTKLLSVALSPQTLTVNGFISKTMTSNINRSILVGQDESGNFRNVPIDTEGYLNVHIQKPSSAFGDLRTIELTPQVQVTFPYSISSDLVDTEGLNGGTITQASSMAFLKTGTNIAGSAKMSTRKILKYRAGLGALARFTGLFTTGVDDSTQIIGVGDTLDGFFFGYVGSVFGIIVRRNGIDDFTPQTSWNIDDMDGNDGISNPSNMLLDQTKINVFEIQFQWLGAGQIDFHIENPLTGHFTPVHRVKYANQNTIPSVLNPSFPLCAFVENTGNTTDLTLKTASLSGFCEGKSIMTGPLRTFGNTKTHSTETALFSLRNKTIFQGITNRISCFVKKLTTGNDVNKLSEFRIYRNTTLGGTPSFTDIDANNSPIEVDTAGTTVTGGTIIFEGVVGKDNGVDFDLTDIEVDIRPGDTITITSASASSEAMRASAIWREDI